MAAETTTWAVAEAKTRFSEVIEEAQKHGPQTITRHGKPTVVIVSAEEWEQRTKPKETLLEFFLNSPLRGSGVKIERMRGDLRSVDL